tara:strand:+ start:1469 stop:1756 length:288 start_codon:yes stop_codon:yes gene_type:complete
MSITTPIYSIAKELNIDSNRIISACKTLGINAKGATKRLNKQELDKVKSYFEMGKNASQEVIDINKSNFKETSKIKKTKEKTKIIYFTNRLIRKS